jgi:hypothetical protein
MQEGALKMTPRQNPVAVRAHFAWMATLTRLLLRCARRDTVMATIARAASQFAQLFSFFIPLKIIILMGSKHVPTYFQGIMKPENLNAWIVGMSVVTLILYVASILFNILSNRMERKASSLLLQHMEAGIAMQKTERQLVRRIVVLLCRTYVSIAIFSLCALALLVIKPAMLLALVGIMLLQFGFTAWLLRRGDEASASWLVRAIGRNPAGYLKTLAAMNFLLVFVLLLLEYWITGKTNVLTAILALLLGRRLFQAAERYATRMLLLHRDKLKIDNLLAGRRAETSMELKGA